MDRKTGWGEHVFEVLDDLLEGDLHGQRVPSPADATPGVMVSASLAVAVIGQSLAQARGLLTRHAIEQIDRLLLFDAFAIHRLTMLGTAGEDLGMDRHLKSNTSKTRAHSVSRQGCMLCELIPSRPKLRLRTLMPCFAEIMQRSSAIQTLVAVS